uniref:Uncharacterized protein n=1 Tax=Candidatus Kentrum sp. LPFa TaxID=2126335 RepID=A0A450W0W4_9GAMM|nr:MAG: hypothetical protein BECKLPF1236A_GA0070988_100427 [Candidatus Kentron sp. LPFa]VFK27060.1 MAG: hypothetical protein BECKLPF1236C_GA0070990_100426 [Candidatus Kentron sp. LPFa]
MLRIGYLFLPLVLVVGDGALAVERAPRISDREIVERLTRLEEGQRSMEYRFSAMEKRMDDRFSVMEKRMDDRFSAMEKRMDDRFSTMQEQMDQRFSALQKQMEHHMMMQWNLILALMVSILGLVGFVTWDRRTALKPLERRFTHIADEVEMDLGMDSPEGSKLARLVGALRELAPEDRKLAEALQRFSLLEDLPQKA